MKNQKDNPGVHVPPPFIYAGFFFLSFFLEKIFPFNNAFLHSKPSSYIGYILIAVAIVFIIRALTQFFKTKNTLITIKPATSLQTNGIYAFTRNPMYLGLLTLYTGIAFLKGNWWTLALIPIVMLIIQTFVIKKEEAYLERAFGNNYMLYKAKVRRWI